MVRLILLLFLFGSWQLQAQNDQPEPIEADRPDQTETPSLVPKGMFQLETGFTYEKEGTNENILSPTALWKYGVNENFELRLITELETAKDSAGSSTGLAPVKIGFKARLARESGIIPKTSIIAHLQLPNVASADFKADHFAALFRFTMQHTLSEKMTLSYNLGAEWDGIIPDATFIYTLTTGFSLTEPLGCYLELFGFAPENAVAYHSFDGGFTYLISNDFMLDASAGVGLTEEAPDYYVSLGFSLRI